MSALNSFLGEYEQIPPMYSAIKIKGKKLYELARKGVEVERAPRTVKILQCELLSCDLPFRAELLVRCSKGTYMRTLCEDLGRKLGTYAHMGRLVRTEAAGFRLEDSFPLDGEMKVTPVEEIPALRGLRRITVSEEFDKKLLSGGAIRFGALNGERLLAYTSNGVLAGIFTALNNEIKPFIMLYTSGGK